MQRRLLRRSGAADWAELLRRSCAEPDWFWPLVIDDVGLEFARPWESVLDDSRGPEWATWFNGGDRLDPAQLRPPVGAQPPGRDRGGRSRRGRLAARAELRRAVARRHPPRGAARRARSRAGRPRGDLPADVAGSRDRLACGRAHRGDPGPGLLGLRGAGGRAAPAGERGEGGDHAARVFAARQDDADARHPRAGTARVAVGRTCRPRAVRARRPTRRPARARRTLGDPVPPHVHLRHDGNAEGRRPRAGRLPRLRSRERPATRPTCTRAT